MARNPWEMDGNSVMDLREPKPTLGQNPWDMPSGPQTAVERARQIRERPISDEEFARRYSYPERVVGRAASIAGQIPIIGNFVPQTPAARDFARSSPTRNTVGGFVAAGNAIAPVSGAVRRGANVAQNMIRKLIGSTPITRAPRASPHLVMDTASQAGLGASINLADRATSDNPIQSNEEGVITGGIGAASGAFGPLASRVRAPSGTGRPLRMGPGPNYRLYHTPEAMDLLNDRFAGLEGQVRFIDLLNRARSRTNQFPVGGGRNPEFREVALDMLNAERGRGLSEATTNNVFRYGIPAISAGIGAHTGGLPGMFYGGIAGEAAQQAFSRFARSPRGVRYLGRQMSPENAALINALSIASGNQLINGNEPQIPTLTGR